MASRYAETTARRAWVPNKRQGMVEIVYRKPPEYVNQAYVDRLSKSSDTMQSLAWERFKDPTMWWVMADMNPKIVCPDDLTYGFILHIPVIRTT